MYTDSHAHLTSEVLLPDLEGILERARAAGVNRVVNICTDHQSLLQGKALRQRHHHVFNAAALTPHDAEVSNESFFQEVIAAAQAGELIAVGETGLDYHAVTTDRTVQVEYLLRHFELAKQTGLPVIFHCRDAFEDLFKWADAHYERLPAVLHCFTGSDREVKEVIARGWYLSISGIITFKNSGVLREAVKGLPLNRLLIETDAPFLAPQTRRGKRNEPSFIGETAAVLGQLYGLTGVEMGKITAENAHNFFSFL